VSCPNNMAGAPQVIGLEKALHFFWEQRIQHFFLRWPDFVRFWNVYYWVAHGSNTIGALLALFFIRPAIYQVRVWRALRACKAAVSCVTVRSLLGACTAFLIPSTQCSPGFVFSEVLNSLMTCSSCSTASAGSHNMHGRQ
jgi:PAP2 superfamily